MARQTGRSPSTILAEWDSAELSEAIAMEKIEPHEDGYWQTALICLTMAQIVGDKKSKLEDFMPKKPVKRLSYEELTKKFQVMRSFYPRETS